MTGTIVEWVFAAGFVWWWYHKVLNDRRNDE